MAWTILVFAGLLEIVWSVALKTLPLATAYTVWVGIGAAGGAAVGILLMGGAASPLRLRFLCLIVIGVVGLRLIEG